MASRSRIFANLLIPLTLAACAPVGKSANEVAEQSLGAAGCKTAQSEMWSSLQAVADKGGPFPSVADLRAALIATGHNRGWAGPKFENYLNAFLNNYEVTIEGIKTKFAPNDTLGWKKALAEMETGEVLHVLATDPGSLRDFQAFSKQTGNELLAHQQHSREFEYFIRRK